MKVAFATLIAAAMYAASLALIGVGLWMVGGGDWRGLGLGVVGLLVWVDLLLAARRPGAARTRPKDGA